jgi:hypothetical protein
MPKHQAYNAAVSTGKNQGRCHKEEDEGYLKHRAENNEREHHTSGQQFAEPSPTIATTKKESDALDLGALMHQENGMWSGLKSRIYIRAAVKQIDLMTKFYTVKKSLT